MDIAVIVLALFAAFAYTLAPILKAEPSSDNINHSAERKKLTDLQKINVLKQIRDIDYEKDIGTLSGDDYQRIRAELSDEAGRAIDASEELQSSEGERSQCPQCMAAILAKDNFCGSCGAKLK